MRNDFRQAFLLPVAAMFWFRFGLTLAIQPQAAVEFSIAAQPLSTAIIEFAKQAKVQVLTAGASVEGLNVSGVSGRLTLSAALERLLKGSGFTYRFVDDKTLVLVKGEAPTALAQKGAGAEAPDKGGDSIRLAQADPGPAAEGAWVAKNDASHQHEKNPAALEEIVVTGTHIRGIAPSSPVIIIDREQIERSGYTDAGEVIRSLPQNFSGGSNPQASPGNASGGLQNLSISGSSSPNLRGLGSGSTLTLINGRRLAQDMPSGAIDISAIPLDAIERIEVVTDGASAIYGADAVAGVVNFILRKDYSGFQTSVGFGKATEGGALDRQISQLLGSTWNGGGGIVNYEHETQDAVYADQRSFTATVFGPFTLLPGLSRNSIFASAHQDIAPHIEAFMDALYTKRDSSSVMSLAPSTHAYSSVPVTEYQVTPGLKTEFSNGWNATLFVSGSEQNTHRNVTSTVGSTAAPPSQTFSGKSKTAELDADGVLLQLPTGGMHLAVGAGYRTEEYLTTTVGSTAGNLDADRSVKYAFGELVLPLVSPSDRTGIRRLELNMSVRYDDYSDAGSKGVPRLALVYAPIEALRITAAASRSFRAPSLYDKYAANEALLYPLTDPLSASGKSVSLIAIGGNPQLGPETATTRSLSVEWAPAWIRDAKATVTYYRIAYTNRIAQMANLFAGLSDPANAPFVTRDPNADMQTALIARASTGYGFYNFAGVPYDPTKVVAFVDDRPWNLSRQDIDGADILLDEKLSSAVGDFTFSLNGSYLDLRQNVTPIAPQVTLSGTAFNPPKFRARGAVTWTRGPWSLSGYVNHLDDSTNANAAGNPPVSSWTTIDAQIAYNSSSSTGLLTGVRTSLSVLNALDRDPPYLRFDTFRKGFNYDTLNATPLNRYVSLRVTKSW
jgi:iron complex outermembrane recepter protein